MQREREFYSPSNYFLFLRFFLNDRLTFDTVQINFDKENFGFNFDRINVFYFQFNLKKKFDFFDVVELFTRRHRLDDLLFAKKKIVPQNIDTNKKLQRQKISMKLEGKSS